MTSSGLLRRAPGIVSLGLLLALVPPAAAQQDAYASRTPLSAGQRDDASVAINENVQDARLLRLLLDGRQLVLFGRLEGELALYHVLALQGESGPDLRRFKLGLAGVQPWFDSISYKFEVGLEGGGADWGDLYVHVEAGDRGDLTVGHQDVTQNLSAATGSLSQMFMEAPLPVDAFSLSQRLGVSWDREFERAAVHAMVFGKDLNGEQDGRGLAARAVYSPYRSDSGIWHFGGSAVWEKADGPVRARNRPESHVTDIRLIDTGAYLDVDRRRAYSLELAGASGRYSSRLEVFRTDWERRGGTSNRLLGAYWEGGLFLTGQRYRYRLGKFLRPRIDGLLWAWELAFRLSWADLNDGDVRGGEERNVGAALNAYPGPGVRGQLNLIHVDSETPGGDGFLLQARLQLNW